MNRKTLHFCTSIGLSLALGLGLGSCKDNDLIDGGSNGNSSIQTEAEAQKYETLQTLLGALADVDSLPSNWNSNTYKVLPTVGVVNNEAEPHVRYVVTSSQTEADRIYRSYLSKDVTGTPTDDSWQQDGIGSMQFSLSSSADCYAKLKVNVQQIPTLEEIRFVPAETLGNNGFLKPSGCYYNFGDVICQTVADPSTSNGIQPTFWVCVRPCSTKESLRKTHWCSFQLVGPTNGRVKYDNFYTLSNNQILPANLCTKKADGERMVQNFFNVLRVLSKPECVYSPGYDYQGIGEIKADDFPYNDIRTIGFMWEYLDLWNKNRSFSYTIDDEPNKGEQQTNGSVISQNYSAKLTDLTTYLYYGGEVNAYYFGYNKASWYNRGDYNVYNLRLSLKNGGLYDKVKKQTYFVYETDKFDFTDYLTGEDMSNNDIRYSWSDKPADDYQFIVKYKTGAELEGADQEVDVDPSESFSKRRTKNGISDILVSGKWMMWPSFSPQEADKKYDEPFFAFGDRVSQLFQGATVDDGLFCIKSASLKANYLSENENFNAWFIAKNDNALSDDNLSKTMKSSDLKLVFFHLLNAYIKSLVDNNNINIGNNTYFVKRPANAINNDNAAYSHYEQSLQTLYNEYIWNNSYVFAIHDAAQLRITITAKIGAKSEDKMRTYKLTYNYGQDHEGANFDDVLNFEKLAQQANMRPIYFHRYKDAYKFYDGFSRSRTLSCYKKNERRDLKTQVSAYESQFMTKWPTK